MNALAGWLAARHPGWLADRLTLRRLGGDPSSTSASFSFLAGKPPRLTRPPSPRSNSAFIKILVRRPSRGRCPRRSLKMPDVCEGCGPRVAAGGGPPGGRRGNTPRPASDLHGYRPAPQSLQTVCRTRDARCTTRQSKGALLSASASRPSRPESLHKHHPVYKARHEGGEPTPVYYLHVALPAQVQCDDARSFCCSSLARLLPIPALHAIPVKHVNLPAGPCPSVCPRA